MGSGGGMSGTDDAAAAAAARVPALPGDIVAEILALVPRDVAFLFRCALVCKRWRRVVADPAFLRRLFPAAGGSSLLGFLVQLGRPNATAWRTVTSIIKGRVPAFVPAPASDLGPRRRYLNSFVRDDTGLLDNAEPLAARDGLVLLRVCPHAVDRELFSLCVCNLLTGKLDVLPPLDAACFDSQGIRGFAIMTSAKGGPVPHHLAHGYSNLFQVLLIGVHYGNRQLHIHSFSSATSALQNWSTVPANCPGLFSGPYGRVATVCCDTAHWLFEEHGSTGPTMYTLDVSVNAGHVCVSRSISNRPSPSALVDWATARLCSTDERLSLLYEHLNHLMIWTRQDVHQGGTAAWTCTQGILVDVKEFWSPRGIPLAIVCVGEKSGTVLVFSRKNPNSAYLLDLQSGSTTKVAGWNGSFNYEMAVPYEIDWMELFMSRLGVQVQKENCLSWCA